MYRELDNLLSEESTVDSWYDDGFLIGKLLHTKDDELLEMCIDTLRSFDNEMGHSYIKMHPEIIKEAKERMDTAGNATKRMLQCFLEVFNIL